MASSSGTFGAQLRSWRALRGLSQLQLAVEADCSPRHVSFLETGRTRPRTDTVLRLGRALEVPRREQNALLRAAGLAPAFPEDSTPERSEAYARVVRMMLDRHEPYPALVFNRRWYVIDMNRAAARSLPAPPRMPFDGLLYFFGPGPAPDMVENADEVAAASLHRARREALTRSDDDLLRRVEPLLEALPGSTPSDWPVSRARIRLGGVALETISTVARFSEAYDVSLDELFVELVFPADEATDRFFKGAGEARDR